MRHKLLWTGFFVLLLNSAYLAAYADPTIFYMGNVLFHLALGILLAFAFTIYLIRNPLPVSFFFRLGTVSILIGAVTGIVLILTGALLPLDQYSSSFTCCSDSAKKQYPVSFKRPRDSFL
jgi:hypothetical protein